MAMRLYRLETCPFCEKVVLSLRRMGLEYESVTIGDDERREVEKVSGQRLVPVLCDEDRVVPDSTRAGGRKPRSISRPSSGTSSSSCPTAPSPSATRRAWPTSLFTPCSAN